MPLRRLPFQNPLVGHDGAGVHVDADEGRAGGRRDGERGAGVVAQHVTPNGIETLRASSATTRHHRDRLRPQS